METKLFKHEKLFDAVELETVTVEGNRYYVTPEGFKYRSVTTILSDLSKDAIVQWRKRVGAEAAQKKTTQAATRGTKLHSLVEQYVNNNPSFLEKALPTTVDLFNTIRPFINDGVEIVHGQEFPLYSHHLQTAGRCDLFCTFNGKKTVLDFKTASKRKKEEWIDNYFIQCATYSLMIQERHDIYVPQIAVLIAVENDEPQLFVKKASQYYDDVKKVFCKR
ncbi:MAG: exonuclease [Micrococcales bacterium]|nr:exonuclease [Micrococcales bacterium]